MTRAGRLRRVVIREARCLVCRCRDSRACPEGCSWVSVNRRAGVGVCSTQRCIDTAAARYVRIQASGAMTAPAKKAAKAKK